MKPSHLAGALAFLCVIASTTATAKSRQVSGPDPHGFSGQSLAVERSMAPSDHKQRARAGRHSVARAGRSSPAKDVSLAGVTPVLASKTLEIVALCGSKIVSTIAGRGNRSNHPGGRAVDLTENPSCIYAQLKEWPGGVSTDYYSVKCLTKRGWISCPHVHVSYAPGGQEWGRRFTHRGPAARHRYAHAM